MTKRKSPDYSEQLKEYQEEFFPSLPKQVLQLMMKFENCPAVTYSLSPDQLRVEYQDSFVTLGYKNLLYKGYKTDYILDLTDQSNRILLYGYNSQKETLQSIENLFELYHERKEKSKELAERKMNLINMLSDIDLRLLHDDYERNY